MEQNIEISWVSPENLKPNSWNTNVVSPVNEEKLDNSIKRLGMFKPILVRELQDGTLEILGGEHRVDRAAKLGQTSVPVINLGTIDDDRAKEIGLVDNGRYGLDDTLALAELLSDLGDKADLSGFLPYSDSDLDTIFSAADIDFSDLEIADEIELEEQSDTNTNPIQTHQIMRFKVPVEDAHIIAEIIEKVIKDQGFNGSDSLTNAGDALVSVFNNLEK